jgi:hypothetical protein
MVRRFACGKSTAVNSTPDSIRFDMKFTLRASRSSLAITRVAPWTRQSVRAQARAGRSFRLPDSISVTSETIFQLNEDQQSDHAYHEERLLLLIDQRAKMTADSDQIPALDIEIMAIWELVRSYRLVKAIQTL